MEQPGAWPEARVRKHLHRKSFGPDSSRRPVGSQELLVFERAGRGGRREEEGYGDRITRPAGAPHSLCALVRDSALERQASTHAAYSHTSCQCAQEDLTQRVTTSTARRMEGMSMVCERCGGLKIAEHFYGSQDSCIWSYTGLRCINCGSISVDHAEPRALVSPARDSRTISTNHKR